MDAANLLETVARERTLTMVRSRHRHATLAHVDLSSGRIDDESIPPEWVERYLGGKGLGARYLYDRLEPGVDPLSPRMPLLFLRGPLLDMAPGEPRFAAVTRSPLTGTFLDSYSGGTFAGRLPESLGGRMGLVVTGAADDPVVLEIDDGDIQLEAADDLWGHETTETDERLGATGVACIGPAGEHRVRFATIAVDGGQHHAGRGGAGAVMGAKRLKAVVSRGGTPIPEPSQLAAVRDAIEDSFQESETGRWHRASETLETIDFADEMNVLPTAGWTADRFAGAGDLGIESVRERAVDRERPDDPVSGGFRVETEDGTRTVPRGSTPIALGAGLAIDDFDAVARLGHRCDGLGMDVIAAGNAVAWAIRAAKTGHVRANLDFGDPDGVESLLEAIAVRDSPLGDRLADGVAAAAADVPDGPTIPTVKSMELSAYHPGRAIGMALAYTTSDRGGCHRRARPIESELFEQHQDPDRIVEAVIEEQNRRAVLWSLVIDDFVGETLDDLGEGLLSAVGFESDTETLDTIGERIWTLTRCFNVREGFDRSDDQLPDSLFADHEEGESDAVTQQEFHRLLDRYYEYRGWDARGRPTSDTLDRLGLEIDRPW